MTQTTRPKATFEHRMNTLLNTWNTKAPNSTKTNQPVQVAELIEGVSQLFGITEAASCELIDSNAIQKSRQKTASQDQLDRALIAVQYFRRVANVLGDQRAAQWFSNPKDALGGSTPLQTLSTRVTTQRLHRYLNALEDGAFG